MDSDRELLELAAKAAGIWNNTDPWNGLLKQNGQYWNPLTDDGDALRLAVRLSIFTTPEFYHYRSLSLFGTPDHDPYAATRRAIVRAAAEIGRNK